MKKSIIVLLHFTYWLLYLFLLCIIVLCMWMGVRNKIFHLLSTDFVFLISVFGIVPAITGFYAFYTYLFTTFLRQKKILALFITGIFVSLICGLAGAAAIAVLLPRISLFHDGLNSAVSLTLIMSIIGLFNGGMALIIRGFIDWYADIKFKEELNKKNYETELALIKSQLHPHFLFNTINNIDVLIEMDAKRASAYLNKLSDIMRFMLYETKTDKIPLAKELEYIEKYIDLQKIRTANPNYVRYFAEGDIHGVMIEPMLFIPFVENAFKHSEHKKAGNVIDIRVIVEPGGIVFECENKYLPGLQHTGEYSGLGSELIKKRLMLLYPGNHVLDISKKNDRYTVKLSLFKNEN